jgi:alcohol dehydrogenase (NADP+)
MEQNLALKRLPEEVWKEVDGLSVQRGGPVRFLDPSRHLGFDIFDEREDQPAGDSAPWDF